MKSSLTVIDYSFWSPEFNSEDRLNKVKFSESKAPSEESKPEAKMVPAMLRRRLTSLGRAVASTVFSIKDGLNSSIPLVFVSRWGDIENAICEINALSRNEEISPTKFATSVHNGIEALISIAAKHTGPQTAIAASTHSVEAGFEVAELYLESAQKVLLVIYDARPPVEFDGIGATHALSLLLSKNTEKGIKLTLTREINREPVHEPSISENLDFEWLRWFESDSQTLVRSDAASRYTWVKAN